MHQRDFQKGWRCGEWQKKIRTVNHEQRLEHLWLTWWQHSWFKGCYAGVALTAIQRREMLFIYVLKDFLFISLSLFRTLYHFLKDLLLSFSLIYSKDKMIMLPLLNNSFFRITMPLFLSAWLRPIYLEHLSCPFSDLTHPLLLLQQN